MVSNNKLSFLKAIRSLGLALITLGVASWIIIGLIYEDFGSYLKFKYGTKWFAFCYDIFVFIAYNLLIIFACFYIIRRNPKSIWFVPLICNAYGIAVLISEPASFSKNSYGIIFYCALVLSLITSIIGARLGKKKVISVNH
jgi:hypothetical protein